MQSSNISHMTNHSDRSINPNVQKCSGCEYMVDYVSQYSEIGTLRGSHGYTGMREITTEGITGRVGK